MTHKYGSRGAINAPFTVVYRTETERLNKITVRTVII
jgi:hypothetical protein